MVHGMLYYTSQLQQTARDAGARSAIALLSCNVAMLNHALAVYRKSGSDLIQIAGQPGQFCTGLRLPQRSAMHLLFLRSKKMLVWLRNAITCCSTYWGAQL